MIKSKIGNRIFIYMILVSLVPLIVSQLYLTQVYEKQMKENVYENSVLVQQSYANGFEGYLSNIELLSTTCFNTGVQIILEDSNIEYANIYSNTEELVRYFNSRLELFDIVKSVNAITIELDNNVVYNLKNKIILEDSIKNELDQELDANYKNQEIRMLDENEKVLLYARKIYSISELGKSLGTIYIEIGQSEIEEYFRPYIEMNNAVIVLENLSGDILYTNYDEGSLNYFINEGYEQQNYNLEIYCLEEHGINMLIYDDMSLLLYPLEQIRQLNMVIMILSFVATVILGRTFSQSVVQPIVQLRQGVTKIREGNFRWHIHLTGDNEITELCDSFNSMTEEMDVLVNQVYLKEISENEAIIASLTAQIDPHFLYNTLEMVKSMADIEGVPEIGEITKSLSLLFRYSTKNDKLLVTIEEELDNLNHYTRIINSRFGNKIVVDIIADPALLKCSIIKLSLQPLIENSIKYGFAPYKGRGRITIKIEKKEDDIYIQHSDSGIGMDSSKLMRVQQELDSNVYIKNEQSGGVGLNNINRRIKLYYGSKYGIKLSNGENSGLCVTMIMPLQYI